MRPRKHLESSGVRLLSRNSPRRRKSWWSRKLFLFLLGMILSISSARDLRYKKIKGFEKKQQKPQSKPKVNGYEKKKHRPRPKETHATQKHSHPSTEKNEHLYPNHCPSNNNCRCPYPGETFLDKKEGVLPPDHPYCQNIKYICPHDDPFDGHLWDDVYHCPAHGKKGKRGGDTHDYGKKHRNLPGTMQNHPVVDVVLPEYHFLCCVQCPVDTVPFHLKLTVDEYPEETSWQLEDSEGNVTECADFEEVATSGVFQRCLPVDACFTFRIFDAAGDGLCCSHGHGGYSLFLDGIHIQEGGEFEYEETLQIGDCDEDIPMTPPPTPLNCNEDEVSVRVQFTTDLFPNELSWAFKNSQGDTLLSSGRYESKIDRVRTIIEDICVDDNACYSFDVMDSFGDGISSPGGYAVYLDGNFEEDVSQSNVSFFFEQTSNISVGSIISCPPNFSGPQLSCAEVESECYETRTCDPRSIPDMRGYCDRTNNVNNQSCRWYCPSLSLIPRAPRQPKCVYGDIPPINCDN